MKGMITQLFGTFGRKAKFPIDTTIFSKIVNKDKVQDYGATRSITTQGTTFLRLENKRLISEYLQQRDYLNKIYKILRITERKKLIGDSIKLVATELKMKNIGITMQDLCEVSTLVKKMIVNDLTHVKLHDLLANIQLRILCKAIEKYTKSHNISKNIELIKYAANFLQKEYKQFSPNGYIKKEKEIKSTISLLQQCNLIFPIKNTPNDNAMRYLKKQMNFSSLQKTINLKKIIAIIKKNIDENPHDINERKKYKSYVDKMINELIDEKNHLNNDNKKEGIGKIIINKGNEIREYKSLAKKIQHNIKKYDPIDKKGKDFFYQKNLAKKRDDNCKSITSKIDEIIGPYIPNNYLNQYDNHALYYDVVKNKINEQISISSIKRNIFVHIIQKLDFLKTLHNDIKEITYNPHETTFKDHLRNFGKIFNKNIQDERIKNIGDIANDDYRGIVRNFVNLGTSFYMTYSKHIKSKNDSNLYYNIGKMSQAQFAMSLMMNFFKSEMIDAIVKCTFVFLAMNNNKKKMILKNIIKNHIKKQINYAKGQILEEKERLNKYKSEIEKTKYNNNTNFSNDDTTTINRLKYNLEEFKKSFEHKNINNKYSKKITKYEKEIYKLVKRTLNKISKDLDSNDNECFLKGKLLIDPFYNNMKIVIGIIIDLYIKYLKKDIYEGGYKKFLKNILHPAIKSTTDEFSTLLKSNSKIISEVIDIENNDISNKSNISDDKISVPISTSAAKIGDAYNGKQIINNEINKKSSYINNTDLAVESQKNINNITSDNFAYLTSDNLAYLAVDDIY